MFEFNEYFNEHDSKKKEFIGLQEVMKEIRKSKNMIDIIISNGSMEIYNETKAIAEFDGVIITICDDEVALYLVEVKTGVDPLEELENRINKIAKHTKQASKGKIYNLLKLDPNLYIRYIGYSMSKKIQKLDLNVE